MSILLRRIGGMSLIAALCGLLLITASCQKGGQEPQMTPEQKAARTDYPDGADVVIMLDSSVGMESEDRTSVRLDAAKAIIDSLGPLNRVALINFFDTQEMLTDLNAPFISLESKENRERLKSLVDKAQYPKEAKWKDLSGVFDFSRAVFDENFNRRMLRENTRRREAGIVEPERRRYMIAIFNNQRTIDLHWDQVYQKRYPDWNLKYWYDILDTVRKANYQIISLALKEKANDHFTRSIATYGQGSFRVVSEAQGFLNAAIDAVAEIDGLVEVTAGPLALTAGSPGTVSMPSFTKEALFFAELAKAKPAAKGKGKTATPASGPTFEAEASFPAGSVNLTAPPAETFANITPAYAAVRVTNGAAGNYTFRGDQANLRAFVKLPLIVVEGNYAPMFSIGDSVNFEFSVYDAATKSIVEDPATLDKVSITANVTAPDGENIPFTLTKKTQAEPGKRLRKQFTGEFKIPNMAKEATVGKRSKQTLAYTKNEDFRFEFTVSYKEGGVSYPLRFNRTIRGADVLKMQLVASSVPTMLTVGDKLNVKVQFTRDGQVVTDQADLKHVKVKLTLKHITAKRMIRELEVTDDGVKGDAAKDDGTFSREVDLKTEFGRNRVPADKLPGEIEYEITGHVPYEGGTVPQVQTGRITITALPAGK